MYRPPPPPRHRRRRHRLTPLLVVALPLMLVAGIWLGANPDRLPGFARDVFVGDDNAQVYDEALEVIGENYYRPVDEDALLDRSLDSAVDSLGDRFSAYFDPKEYASFQEATSGEFEGVGMTVQEVERGLEVVEVFRGSPAAKGGLRRGDVIAEVNGRSIAGATSEEATSKIKGPEGTSVRLSVLKGGKRPARTVTLERARVDVPVVEARMRERDGMKVAHVALATFSSGAHGEVGAAVRRLLKRGAEGVVLDLRNNGGGLLNEAVLVSSVFIPEGTIVKTKGRARPEQTFEASGKAIDESVPVVVLVNGDSASASEIVAGAIQDRERGTVVGTPTFGKGVFQEVRRLSNGGALDITVGEYFTPEGRNLGGGGTRKGAGIKPDVRASDDTETERDEALDVAVRTVARKAT